MARAGRALLSTRAWLVAAVRTDVPILTLALVLDTLSMTVAVAWALLLAAICAAMRIITSTLARLCVTSTAHGAVVGAVGLFAEGSIESRLAHTVLCLLIPEVCLCAVTLTPTAVRTIAWTTYAFALLLVAAAMARAVVQMSTR